MDKDIDRMSQSPIVTVLMPVYNGERYLREAVESILSQRYKDLEFIIIDDGSEDQSAEIIKSYNDPHILFFQNGKNLGLVATLNKGIELAKGRYIARMDCDDISLPERLEKQVSFMDKNPEIAVCGTWIKIIGKEEIWRYPTESKEIKCKLLFESAIAHPSVMIRTNVFLSDNIRYNINFEHAEDYGLWVNLSNKHHLANVDEVLLRYRLHDKKIGSIYNKEQVKTSDRIRKSLLTEMRITLTDDEFSLHSDVSRWIVRDSKDFMSNVQNWFMRIEQANKISNIYDPYYLHKELVYRWLAIWYLSPLTNFKYIFSPYTDYKIALSFLRKKVSGL